MQTGNALFWVPLEKTNSTRISFSVFSYCDSEDGSLIHYSRSLHLCCVSNKHTFIDFDHIFGLNMDKMVNGNIIKQLGSELVDTDTS